MMSQAEFKLFVYQPLDRLYHILWGMKGTDVLKLLRELQQGLAAYSAMHPLDKETQFKALEMMARVERTARKEFVRWKKREILKTRPDLSHPARRQTLKQLISAEWGAIYAKSSY